MERVVLKAIQNGIAIYATHTALDNSNVGVSAKMCEVLGLKNQKILIQKEDESIGMGMIGTLETEMTEEDFLNHLKKTMKTDCIRHSKLLGKPIKKVAVLGGSGSFAISNAIRANADIYVTSDLKYHEFFKAENKLVLADIGHYESEQFTKNLLVDHLTKKITNFAPALPTGKIVLSENNTNPIYYR